MLRSSEICSDIIQSRFGGMAAIRRTLARSSMVAAVFVLFSVVAFIVSTRYLEFPGAARLSRSTSSFETSRDIPLNCLRGNLSGTCPPNYYPSKERANPKDDRKNGSSCPDYFRYIYDDLWPWRETGISKEMVMRAQEKAHFRLVILKGRVYVETYRQSFQSRGSSTLWGILQLLRKYPGKMPDLDLMFHTNDWPYIKREDFVGPNRPPPPPVFRFCGDDSTFHIVFPDWSFWGWPELNIKPWNVLSQELKEENRKINWTDRDPHAYWKGNPHVSGNRMDLLRCNVSDKEDWGARVYEQNWKKEQQQGFKDSNLASQCKHRYKIYVEGVTWSVSQKYIVACDSVTLAVRRHFFDFFSRSLVPLKHFWPIKVDDKCRSIKHAVEWGNSHQQKAQAIGKAASSFMLEEVKMDYVYDYVFHLLSQYAKLLKYKPSVPQNAVEICSESMACPAQGLEKQFMIDSIVKGPALSKPCTMPPPYDPASFHSFVQRKENGVKQVESWEKAYWKRHNKHK